MGSGVSKAKHELYNVWQGMIARCYRPAANSYELYGGRGITVCDAWISDFWIFIRDMGQRPSPTHSIDRYPDNNGNYEPKNTRWATKPEQSHNMRNNINITCGGVTRTVNEWSKETGISRRTIRNRLVRGGGGDDAVREPQKKRPGNTLMPPGGYEQCAALGLNANTVSSRLRYGWTYEEAITTPIDHKKASKKKGI